MANYEILQRRCGLFVVCLHDHCCLLHLSLQPAKYRESAEESQMDFGCTLVVFAVEFRVYLRQWTDLIGSADWTEHDWSLTAGIFSFSQGG